MIKELFEIESTQKNVLVIFIGIFCISFLQLFLFKNSILIESAFINIGLSLALTFVWILINLLPVYSFFHSILNGFDSPCFNVLEIAIRVFVFSFYRA